MPTRISGLVLAAGGSSRLGQPKQLLPFGGATLLDRAGDDVAEVAVPGPVQLDVDTWEDYQAVLAR